MKKKIAQVVVGLPVEGPFDYLVGSSLEDKAAVGQRVKVSFHMGNRVGFITGFRAKSSVKRLKPVLEIIDAVPVLDNNMMTFTREFSDYYGCSWGEAIETSLPGLLRKGRGVEILPCDSPKRPSKESQESVLIHDKGTDNRWPLIIDRMKKAIAKGQGIIFLVPEVHLIDTVRLRLQPCFSGEISILDKKLTPKKETDTWAALKSGKTQLVVGTRSAIFAPIRNLGLIIVYEEENNAYKQEQSPYYHIRETALMRARIEGGDVVFVSCVPSAEMWALAKNKKLKLVSSDEARLSDMQVIDMSNYNPRKSSIISVPLRNAMEKTLQDNGRIVLFMNRKGFSTQTACSKCGFIIKCERCDVSLTYLFEKKKMVCRRCGASKKLPSVCPKCQSAYLSSKGIGIEKLESEVARVFPQARVSHYDKDSKEFPKNFSILIATQAVLKHQGEIPVSLVGVLRVDSEINRLDFRSAQKVFSLLVHLRQFASDKLIVQTRMPDNYCLTAAHKWDFNAFYRQELKFRKDLQFPPYQRLVAINLRAGKEETVFGHANELHDRMIEAKPKGVEILDPHPDVVPKLRDKYRYMIMVRGKKSKPVLQFIKAQLKDFKKGGVTVTVNVDP